MDPSAPNYPPELPVTGYREKILAALRASPVVIVCGDTGSGKTTQLPKMVLETLRPPRDAHGTGRGARGPRIAVTQPRRLAAVTMAERVAAELKSEVGGLVGYRHRFGRKVSPQTEIEFMTDGVLLAETRGDPLLRRYDAIIVDEAHERSLNVDFLLGILKRILTRRRDLKVVVSSATLDTASFSAFFGDAPTIAVPGRLFPIDVRYRPPPEDEERDLPRDVVEAVAELPERDDVLVFLPGERDIRETADALADARGAVDDVIPLLASLPAADQRRAFLSSPRRRIILATNVAETSVTIPGIRAVVDSGLARIARYVHRTQVDRLQIEPVSQASARQRAGRCGRLGPGTCIRLYSEEDFLAREAYTPPEVLRSSLAGVILTMLDLGLGDIERFPFLDPPKPAMIHEGLKELLELGAIRRAGAEGARRETRDAKQGRETRDGEHGRETRDARQGHEARDARQEPETKDEKTICLTEIGKKLAKIPVEPRLARMLLAAAGNAVLPSVLPLVAAMACDDPRRRPIDEREKADQAHARFRVAGSDFLGTLALWDWWTDETAGLSQSKARKLCKATYLSYPKMREWSDLARQLESLAKRLGLSFATQPVKTARDEESFNALLHRSLLAGLLGRIGHYDEEERDYRGAHALRFALHPSSVLTKKARPNNAQGTKHKALGTKQQPPEWIVAGELVDTARLFARNAAAIDPRWIEPVAGDVCRHSYHSPEWDPRSGFVRATEQVTLYGLVIVPARRCDYSRIDPAFAREVFIRRGLVDGEFPQPPPVVRANCALLDELRRLAEKMRRPELFDADRLYAHFDRILPQDVCSANALRKWLLNGPHGARTLPSPANDAAAGRARAPREPQDEFRLRKEDWWPGEGEPDRDFPDSIRVAGVKLSLTYRNTPDEPETDGVTCSVRRRDAAALRLWRHDWLVPGLLPQKLLWMLSVLPSSLRRVLSPLDDAVTILLPLLKSGDASLAEAVRAAVQQRWGFRIPEDAWAKAHLPEHFKIRFVVRDDDSGRPLAAARDLDEVLGAIGVAATRGGVALRRAPTVGPDATDLWPFGDIPEVSRNARADWSGRSYPALTETTDGITVRIHPDAASAARSHTAATLKLLVRALAKKASVPFRRKGLPLDAALYLKTIDYADEQIADDIFAGAVSETLVRGRPDIRSPAEFENRLAEDLAPLRGLQTEIAGIVIASAASANRIFSKLEQIALPEETVDSISAQLAWMLYRGFPRSVPLLTLRRYARYLKGTEIRLDRARTNPRGDLSKEERFAPHWARIREGVALLREGKCRAETLDDYRRMVEEYRVSLFAQELRTPEPVSPPRLEALWAAVADKR